MKPKLLIVLGITLCVFTGCFRTVYTTQLPSPLPVGGTDSRRSTHFVKAKAPTPENFPKVAEWKHTHNYNDGTSGTLAVYTTPLYYGGQIGVILDDDWIPVTDQPVIQVSGGKTGRRWPMYHRGTFFEVIEELSKPAARILPKPDVKEHIVSIINETSSMRVSIGDELFILNRFFARPKYQEYPVVEAPTKEPFPEDGRWSLTHFFSDPGGDRISIYTSPSYYAGTVGVMLDPEDKLVSDKPIIQVEGRDVGMRWPLSYEGPFFARKVVEDYAEYDKPWGLRYGGKVDGIYTFELVMTVDPSVTGIIQTVKISEEDYLNGFTVKNVRVMGEEVDQNGVIQYRLDDLLN